MGVLDVPANAYYGANTRRAELNFPISDLRFSRSFVRAIAQVKQCAAEVNLELEALDAERFRSHRIRRPAGYRCEFDDAFVVDIFQTGSGTSTNMNANEVISNVRNRSVGRRTRAPEIPSIPTTTSTKANLPTTSSLPQSK